MDNERRMIVDELVSEEARSWLKESSKTHWKNSEEARKLRDEGNDVFAEMPKDALQMEEIYKLYSQSIASAECDSEELAFGYGNRSAILLRMQKYKECISDINSALKINNSEKFNIKLLCRKVECIKKLIGFNTESKKLFSECENLISAMKDKDTNNKTLKESMEKVKNMRVPCIETDRVKNQEISEHVKLLNDKENENPFDSVSIRWDKKYGRYLVANRDFMPGEIVFVEKPYVKVVNLKYFHNFCGHCLSVSWATIPCNYCNWCMFCSEDCKRTSWESYHNIECPVVAQIIKKRGSISQYEQLAIRALVLGIKEVGSVHNLKEEIESIDACADNHAKGFQKNGSFQSLGLNSMYTLNDEVATAHLPKCTTNSVFILISLIKHTSLFDENKECSLENILVNDEMLFIGSLLLKLYKVSNINCQQIQGENSHQCKYFNELSTCHFADCCNRGYCITIINSLINNDCHPQVTNIISKISNKFTVCSLRPIKKDSQIFLTYCGSYFDMPKHNRQSILKTRFNFTCTCKACEENWPTLLHQFNVLLQNEPSAFFTLCQPKEILHLFDEADTVLPIVLDYYNKAKCTLNTIQILSKAICKAYKDLKHPSLSLWRLESCMKGAIEKLYESC